MSNKCGRHASLNNSLSCLWQNPKPMKIGQREALVSTTRLPLLSLTRLKSSSNPEATTLLYGLHLRIPMLLERQMNAFWKSKIIYIISCSINASRTRHLYKALAHLTHKDPSRSPQLSVIHHIFFLLSPRIKKTIITSQPPSRSLPQALYSQP